MSTVSVDEETKKRVIQKRKAGISMRVLSKEEHLSFTTISKIWKEKEGQTEPNHEKLTTTKAFQLFERGMNLVQVTMELDLNPKEAEEIHQDYLKLKGLDEIIREFGAMKKYIPIFIEFVHICEENRPEHKNILDILNLQKVIYSQMNFKWKLLTSSNDLERKIAKLHQEEEATNQRIYKLKQEEYNRWYGLYGNGQY
jgi:hypothetical protein